MKCSNCLREFDPTFQDKTICGEHSINILSCGHNLCNECLEDPIIAQSVKEFGCCFEGCIEKVLEEEREGKESEDDRIIGDYPSICPQK